MKFCEKLKLLREERGMSLSEFANLLGTSKQVLSRYERGENTPKITTVAHYAKVLDVSLAYLMKDNITDKKATAFEDKTNAPDIKTEGEKKWMELYHRLSNETREMLITSLDSLDTLTPEQQQLALDLIRVALKNRK